MLVNNLVDKFIFSFVIGLIADGFILLAYAEYHENLRKNKRSKSSFNLTRSGKKRKR